MVQFQFGDFLNFPYKNYKGETSQRSVIFLSVRYGSNEYYAEDQWFINCWDLDKQTMRSFALNKIDTRKIINHGPA